MEPGDPAPKPSTPTGAIDITVGGSLDARERAIEDAIRPFLMVTFMCANAYQRVYRAKDGTHYLARCPKCAKSMRFVVGEGGSQQRTFQVSCR